MANKERIFVVAVMHEEGDEEKTVNLYWESGSRKACDDWLRDMQKTHVLVRRVRIWLESDHERLADLIGEFLELANSSHSPGLVLDLIVSAMEAGMVLGVQLSAEFTETGITLPRPTMRMENY